MAVTKRKTKTATKAKKASAGKKVPINYKCFLGFCTAFPNPAHLLAVGNRTALKAIGTDVTITFRGQSPFQSGNTRIRIPAGTTQIETVARKGRFRYTLSCKECRSPGGPPEMIIP